MTTSTTDIGLHGVEAVTAPFTARPVRPVERMAPGRGWVPRDEAAIAEALARQAATSVDHILEMRRTGRGWTAIARTLGVSVPAAARRAVGPERPAAGPAPAGGLDFLA